MYHLKKTIIGITLGLAVTTAVMAAPKELITNNLTNVESNAFVSGTIPSQHPTKAHSVNKVMWAAVRLACIGHNPCWAIIKMATDTANPVELGKVTIDLNTGMITPTQLSANGYSMVVNGPASITLSESH